MENVIAALILVVVIGGAATYLVNAKKNGVKCVGCPAGGSCSRKQKKRKKKLKGKIIAKKKIEDGKKKIMAVQTLCAEP